MFNILNQLRPVRLCKDCDHSILDVKYGHNQLTCSCMEVNKHYSEYVASTNPNNVSVWVSCFIARSSHCGNDGKYFTTKVKVELPTISEDYRIEFLDQSCIPQSFSCRAVSEKQAFDLFKKRMTENGKVSTYQVTI